MSLIASKLCEYIIPDSSTNTDAENYEYFLVWIGVDGGVYSYMFEDFTKKVKVDSEVINSKSDNISNLFKGTKNTIQLTAEDLTENEFDVISNITRSPLVRRYHKDNTYENLAIVTNSFSKPKSQFRYNFEIEVQEIDDKIIN